MNISILIPTYNDVCLTLAETLARQAAAVDGLQWEILVGDDGSDDAGVVEANRQVNALPNTTYIIRCKNSGRAAIRNFLARQARYERLLFIDADMTIISDDFLLRYLQTNANIVYGGYQVSNGTEDNLRYLYERASAPVHSVANRAKVPYRDFHTSNFIIRRSLMLAHPFDERFQHYGYEDVLYGKVFQQLNIPICHIDNPTGFCTFEDNSSFVKKTEEGLRTLYQFRHELEGFSNILNFTDRLRRMHLTSLVRTLLTPFSPALRRNLCGSNPSLKAFQLYKVSYYLRHSASQD